MKWTTLLLLAILTKSCFAEDLKIIEKLPIQGQIGNQTIFMTLVREDSEVHGTYYYIKYKTPIKLTGKWDYSSLSLIENQDQTKAEIDAKIDENLNIAGKWTGNKKYDFTGKILINPYKNIFENIAIKTSSNNEYYLMVYFKSKKIQEIPLDIEPNINAIYLDDFNFDGYPDLQVPDITSGANSSYMIYIYNPKQEEYELAPKEIRNLTNPKVDHYSREIKSIIRENCCSYKAKIITSSTIKRSEFDYLKEKGVETTLYLNNNLETKKSISKEYFEKIYMK